MQHFNGTKCSTAGGGGGSSFTNCHESGQATQISVYPDFYSSRQNLQVNFNDRSHGEFGI